MVRLFQQETLEKPDYFNRRRIMEKIMQTEPTVFYLPELLDALASGGKADRNQIKSLLGLSRGRRY